MSRPINSGGPAFPRPSWAPTGYTVEDIEATDPQEGMSLRDWFAGQIVAAYVNQDRDADNLNKASRLIRCKSAYEWADAMLEARDRA